MRIIVIYIMHPIMEPFDYFDSRDPVVKKKYDSLRDFFYNREAADTVALKYGYTRSAFYSLTKDFRKFLSQNPEDDYFFRDKTRGRKHKEPHTGIDQAVIDMRKKNYSAEDILQSLQAAGNKVSYQYVYKFPGRAVRYLPAPPQTRTSVFFASGSSVVRFAKMKHKNAQ